jgi:hypothetical protein
VPVAGRKPFRCKARKQENWGLGPHLCTSWLPVEPRPVSRSHVYAERPSLALSRLHSGPSFGLDTYQVTCVDRIGAGVLIYFAELLFTVVGC